MNYNCSNTFCCPCKIPFKKEAAPLEETGGKWEGIVKWRAKVHNTSRLIYSGKQDKPCTKASMKNKGDIRRKARGKGEIMRNAI